MLPLYKAAIIVAIILFVWVAFFKSAVEIHVVGHVKRENIHKVSVGINLAFLIGLIFVIGSIIHFLIYS